MSGPGNCWPWQGHLSNGYGRVGWDNRRWVAHRLVSILCHGELPTGIFVLHCCDNPQCCNPNHLWRGTLADNNHDRDEKGRRALPPTTKLTEDDVILFRRRFDAGDSVSALAEEFGVHRNTGYQIVNRQIWKEVGV
jgi:hypothetical protein